MYVNKQNEHKGRGKRKKKREKEEQHTLEEVGTKRERKKKSKEREEREDNAAPSFDELYKATGGKRLGMRARCEQPGKIRRTEE